MIYYPMSQALCHSKQQAVAGIRSCIPTPSIREDKAMNISTGLRDNAPNT